MEGPDSQSHQVSPGPAVGERGGRVRGVPQAQAVAGQVQQAAAVAEPVRPVDAEHPEQRVDRAAAGEQEDEDQADGHRAGDGREVERRPEEALGADPRVEHQRQAQGDHRLQRHDQQDVPGVVAQRRHEVLPGQARLGEDRRVVVEPDEAHRAAERRPAAAPVGQAHPERHEDRDEHEQPDQHGLRGGEGPPRPALPGARGAGRPRPPQGPRPQTPRGGRGGGHPPTSGSRLVWVDCRTASGSPVASPPSWLSKSSSTCSAPGALTGPWAYSAPSM